MLINNKNKIYSFSFIALLLNITFISNCRTPFTSNVDLPYVLTASDAKHQLQHRLTEVSGLSFTANQEVALIEDENGFIFYYNLISKKITHKITFGKDGDYEDLKIIGDTAYIIRSDGILVQLTNINASQPDIKKTKFRTGLTKKNNTEGLCYDDQQKLLLIVCKGTPEKKVSDKKYKNKKAIYSFNPETKLLSDTPLYLIDVNEVRKNAYSIRKNAIDKIIRFYTHVHEKSDFEPSGIAIQPFSRDIYVISSVGKLLVILDAKGKFKKVIKLSPVLFKQPEGITFDSEGNLYISNEGRKGRGNILMFRYIKSNNKASKVL